MVREEKKVRSNLDPREICPKRIEAEAKILADSRDLPPGASLLDWAPHQESMNQGRVHLAGTA
jgi:hypothetical protein